MAGQCAQSLVHRYRFDPGREHKIGDGDRPDDPARQAARIVIPRQPRGIISLKRGARSAVPHPRCLVPSGPVPAPEQKDAIARVGSWVLEHGIDAPGPYRAARDLLLRRPPRLGDGAVPASLVRHCDDEAAADAAVRLAHELEDGCLAIQGPPGSGKTWTGARLILSLTAAGHRVGVTANSHKAIANLLDEVCAQAEDADRRLRILQKAPEDGRCSHRMVAASRRAPRSSSAGRRRRGRRRGYRVAVRPLRLAGAVTRWWWGGRPVLFQRRGDGERRPHPYCSATRGGSPSPQGRLTRPEPKPRAGHLLGAHA